MKGTSIQGRTLAQAVPTAAACGICGGQSGAGERFLGVLRFPLPILILPTAPHSSIIRGW
jgi:hypothetical protein